jgi:glycosyltransferase involved in cell wall biosynthesis
MQKILLVQRSLQPPGGGNAVAVWMIEALKQEFEVTTLTAQPIDIEAINRFYGTSLTPTDFRTYVLPWPLRQLQHLDPDPFSIQPLCLLMRRAKQMRPYFDVIISTDGEADVGCPAIQYVHYPWLARLYQPQKGLTRRTYWQFINAHCRPWRLVSGFSFERMKQNFTLVNSNWTGNRFEEFYGVQTQTIYPPVAGAFPQTPWPQRENGFVCLGRIDPEKRQLDLIDLVARLRTQGHNLRLHLVGTRGSHPEAVAYYRRVQQQVQENADWVFLHENLSRAELLQLVSRQRYGLHGMPDEHFGIAVAEMVQAGCIVFVRREGGQTEIVGGNDRLLYGSIDEAVAKIERVLNSHLEQQILRNYLNARQNLFSTDTFKHRIAAVVQQFMVNKNLRAN